MLEWTEVKVVDGVDLRLVASASGIRAIEFDPRPVSEWPAKRRESAVARGRAPVAGLLRRGHCASFYCRSISQGTDFQKRVWRQVAAIPYGETRSYLQIAAAIGSPRAVRAVGAANGANPVPIVVPCHRVIGANGKLVGYGGGLAMKKRLLELEGAIALPLAL